VFQLYSTLLYGAFTTVHSEVSVLQTNVCEYFMLIQEVKHKEDIHRLLRTISHEIRNPLHGILGNAQALLDMLQEAEQRVAAATAEVTRQTAVAAAAAVDSAVTTDATVHAARCARKCNAMGYSAAGSACSCAACSSCDESSCALSYAATSGTNQSSNSSTVNCSATAAAAEQQQHSASISDTAVANADSIYAHASPACSTHSSSSGGRRCSSSSSSPSARCDSSSSSCSTCSKGALLHELSRKLQTVKEMVAEIHECGLHQVSLANTGMPSISASATCSEKCSTVVTHSSSPPALLSYKL
jgi:His Kinase A (phospho-acceptor) domain